MRGKIENDTLVRNPLTIPVGLKSMVLPAGILLSLTVSRYTKNKFATLNIFSHINLLLFS